METIKELERKCRKEIASAEADLEHFKKAWARKLEEAESFGGFCSVDEAAAILDCSNQRISVLKCRGTLRSCSQGFSLADVRKYKASRRIGRPKKVVPEADRRNQFEASGRRT